MSTDGKILYSIGSFGFHALNIEELKTFCEDPDVRGTLFRILHGADSRMIVVADKRLIVYNFSGFSFDTIHMEQEHTKRIISMEISPDESLVATGDETGCIKIWDARILSKP